MKRPGGLLCGFLVVVWVLTGCNVGARNPGVGDSGGAGETAGTADGEGDIVIRGQTDEAADSTDAAHAATPQTPAPIHDAFAYTTVDELASLVADLPEVTRLAVARRPWFFLELVDRVLDAPRHQTILVDKTHPLAPSDEPDDLVTLVETRYALVVNNPALQLSASVLPDLFAMVETARQDGITLDISSTFRSYAYQEGLFQRWVDRLGLEQAERESARAGTSQHQLGTTIDFGSVTPEFADTAAGRWLAERASQFGFSLSYPPGMESLTGYVYEPWHFRYIGRDAATLEQTFFDGVQQHMLTFLHERREELEDERR